MFTQIDNFKTHPLICEVAFQFVLAPAHPLPLQSSYERVGSSVGATVKLSILNARWENKPTTRDNAPDSFSNKTDKFYALFVLLFVVCLKSSHSSPRRELALGKRVRFHQR